MIGALFNTAVRLLAIIICWSFFAAFGSLAAFAAEAFVLYVVFRAFGGRRDGH